MPRPRTAIPDEVPDVRHGAGVRARRPDRRGAGTPRPPRRTIPGILPRRRSMKTTLLALGLPLLLAGAAVAQDSTQPKPAPTRPPAAATAPPLTIAPPVLTHSVV